MADSAQSSDWTIALDGGTTNTRARLLDGRRVVATARRAVGVRDAVIGAPAMPLTDAIRECVNEVSAPVGSKITRIIAAGMLTSEVGLCPVPHVLAPAGPDELAAGVVERAFPEISTIPIQLIPGVRTPAGNGPDGWADADVMRGEECETLGALIGLKPRGPQVFLWPGSHTKLLFVDAAGRIVRSFTTLAGEMLSALARHTLLAASLPEAWPEVVDDAAYASGFRLARELGLGRAAFLVRISTLAGHFDPAQRAAFWLGAVIAHDVACLAPRLGDLPVWVGGRTALREHYARALVEIHQAPVTPLDEDLAEAASALGAMAIVERQGVRG